MRRDFNINALYYDIKTKAVHIIGNPSIRFEQDPVRMIRAVRFQTKLGFQLSNEIKLAIFEQAPLLGNISAARLYEECITLFHNEYGFEVYERLEKYGLLKYLFKQTHKNELIKKALLNT